MEGGKEGKRARKKREKKRGGERETEIKGKERRREETRRGGVRYLNGERKRETGRHRVKGESQKTDES